MADIAALREEITNDPLSRGYAGMTDQQVADDLNTEYRLKNKASISGDEVFQQTDPAEFANLADGSANNTADIKTMWITFCGKDSIDPFNANNVSFVQWVFGAESQTVQNLGNIRTYNISRAEELNLLGKSKAIGPAHVAEARA